MSLLHAAADGATLHLKLLTPYPTAAVRGGDLGAGGPCAAADHELSLSLEPGSSTGALRRVRWCPWQEQGVGGKTYTWSGAPPL